MAFNETWDETKPEGSRARSLGDDDIREFKRAIQERLGQDHETAADESGNDNIGYHKRATLIDSVSDQAAVTGCGVFYVKTISGKIELYYRNPTDGVVRLTYNGAIRNAVSTLDDVVLTDLAANQMLWYDSGAGKWVNITIHVSASGYAKYKA